MLSDAIGILVFVAFWGLLLVAVVGSVYFLLKLIGVLVHIIAREAR